MSDRFTSHGKQVLLNGAHYADAVSEEDAFLIAETMQQRVHDIGLLRQTATIKLASYTGAWQAGEDYIWRQEDVGKVTPGGNIVGSAAGTLWGRGTIYVTRDQAKIAERHGWRILDSESMLDKLSATVQIQR